MKNALFLKTNITNISFLIYNFDKLSIKRLSSRDIITKPTSRTDDTTDKEAKDMALRSTFHIHPACGSNGNNGQEILHDKSQEHNS